MNKLEKYQRELRRVDEFARMATPIHALHPLAKIVTTLVFLLVVVSFPERAIINLLLLFSYPVFIATAANIPWDFLLLRLLMVSPFVAGLAISGLIFEQIARHDMIFSLLLFLGIILKFSLTVLAALLLLASTGLARLASSLYILPIPNVFINQLLFLYRYIYVLLVELLHTMEAYSLRAAGRKVGIKTWGSMAGQILLRTLNRVENIHGAMLLRGFNGKLNMTGGQNIDYWDIAYMSITSGIILLVRFTVA